MPIFRDKHGKPKHDVTEVVTEVDRSSSDTIRQDNSDSPYSRKTRVVDGNDPRTDPTFAEGYDTQRDTKKTVVAGYSAPTPGEKTSINPVVGWLVVVEGNGKGSSVEICMGVNSIGRDSSQNRINLNFGDEQISREKHAEITYDHKARRYFINHGGGVNPTYIGEDILLAPTQIYTGDTIQFGETIIRFVALCGDEFGWDS